MAGVLIPPATPPVPRLSVLPWAMPVKPGELTTPPSATVSVPIKPQPQLVSPTTSEERAFRTEPAPVTVTAEDPVGSPIPMRPVELTTPPLEIVSIPGPPKLPPPPTAKPVPTFQVEPAPVTVTVGIKSGLAASIAAPPGVLSRPPLAIVTDAGPMKELISVIPVGLTFTVEPGPLISNAEDTTKLVVWSAPPLMTERVPPSTKVPPTKGVGSVTLSDPPLMVRPLESQLQTTTAPISLPWPVRVSSAESSISSVPVPVIVPANVVLLLPAKLRVARESMLKVGRDEELFVIPLLMVKIAPETVNV